MTFYVIKNYYQNLIIKISFC